MKTLRFTFLKALFIGAASMVAACGSSVNNEGAGGSTSSSSVGGDPITAEQACLDFCHKQETAGCPSQAGDCGAYCDIVLDKASATCHPQLVDFFTCMDSNAQACADDPPAACQAKEDAIEACVKQNGCGESDCSDSIEADGTSSCECTDTCKMKEYKAACDTAADGKTSCECYIGADKVGSCDSNDATTCDTQKGCCNQFFKL